MAKFTGKSSSFLINTAPSGAATYVAVGQVSEIGAISVSADEVDVTTLDATDYRQYIQGFKDPGECELSVIFDPELVTQSAIANGLVGLFASGAVKNCAIKINTSHVSGLAYLLFAAFVRDITYGPWNPDDPQTVAPVFRITGPVTLANVLPTTLLDEPEGSPESLRAQEEERLRARRAALEAEEERLRRRAEEVQPIAA